MKAVITCQIADELSSEQFIVKKSELVQFGQLLGLKFRLVEGRHYTDTFRASLSYTHRYKAYLRLNAVDAYCALKGILCTVDLIE